ncbi:MAG: hypothetical protein H7235_01315, partial [Bdellovibrionaceae bacterium]|nr:hypothetical protein [Pseudobdellovibrionaceae bacterium]
AGPVTWGAEGSHDFKNGMSVEATYVRLHEPGSPFINSFLDEAQLTLLLKKGKLFSQPVRVGVTAWKNRMMDMYISVGGIEISREGKINLNIGLYAGTATRKEAKGNFVGAQAGASVPIGRFTLSVSQMTGFIKTSGDSVLFGSGRYEKSSLGLKTDINIAHRLPITLALSTERRTFNFGNGGPISDPEDTYIAVTAIKIPVKELLQIFKKPRPN